MSDFDPYQNQDSFGSQPQGGMPTGQGDGSVWNAPPAALRAATKKEFLQMPENQSLRKQIRTAAIICYVCAGITLLVAIFAGSALSIIDVVILVGLGLGIHLAQSKVCAIVLAVYAVANVIITLVVNGSLGGWLIILAAVYACIATFKLDKAWNAYRNGMN